ncbi:hypothetical protein B7P43_G06050 [Cryptotermes secundus]|uniref:C2H2-type domain-containing protein n=1 Tax=Cryptotermes secundus TaxID=105785 RepID=A0A2J7RSM8_9NEOP|nr:hypothetical protein B7P43_G06050 [Cryptotermes secundus]
MHNEELHNVLLAKSNQNDQVKEYEMDRECSKHGWNMNAYKDALDKLGFRHVYGQSPVEPVQPNVAFDIASLVLYGCQALPIRLKILLDRLFSVLQREEVLQVLHGFGWTHEDYARGYILQYKEGTSNSSVSTVADYELDGRGLIPGRDKRFSSPQRSDRNFPNNSAHTDTATHPIFHPMGTLGSFPEEPHGGVLDRWNICSPEEEPLVLQQFLRFGETRAITQQLLLAQQDLHPPSSTSLTEARQANGSPEKDDCGTLVKRVKLSESDMDEMTSNLDSNEDSLSVVDTHSLKEENGAECAVFTSKSVRKRKNQNPTRCAIPSIMGHNDLMSDEDSSSDAVYAAATPEENVIDIQQWRDDSNEIKTSVTPLIPADKLKKEKSQPERTEGSSITSNGPDSPSEDNSQNMFFHDSGGFISNLDVPIDKDNPRRCTACGKIFQNHFGVKTHFQNVHLKLMHKCTVEGCNAAFPSKRSRDRHSANLNLHRKLLSTSSSDKSGGGLFLEKSPFASLAGSPSLHTEQMLINGDRIPPPHPSLLLPPLGSLAGFPGLNNFTGHLSSPAAAMSATVNGTSSLNERKERSSGSNSPASPPSPPTDRVATSPSAAPGNTQVSLVYSVEEDSPVPDHDGFLSCSFCRKSLPDTGALKEHYEQLHLGEMFRCTVPGCDKVFSSRNKRNLHSDNETLHSGAQHCAPTSDSCS